MAWIVDGFHTTVTFANAPSGVVLYIQEKEVTPPSIEIGELDTTTLANLSWYTKSPKRLKLLGNTVLVCKYDPAFYSQIEDMIGVITSVGITFPDDSIYEFRGWIDSFTPNAMVVGEMATATVVIVSANQTAAGVEVAPAWDEGSGEGEAGPYEEFPYGIQGSQGFQGDQGPQGYQGYQGPQGTQGWQGPKGNQGASGAAGSTGATGAQGSQGLTGNQGDQGITGNQGDQGATGSTGATGAQGTQGLTGNQGDQGATGAVGADGVVWRGTWSGATAYVLDDLVADDGTTYICILGHTNYQPPNGTYWNIFALEGTQGSQGAQGSVGNQGDQGAAGATGSTGATGSQGNQGATGAQGSVGNQGDQGAAGATGSTGATGSQGNQGATGAQGSVGNQGNQGAAGATGSTGATGSQGNQGAVGAQGSVGNQGNQGAAGATGSTGATGSQGAQGLLGDALAHKVTIESGGSFEAGVGRSIQMDSGGIKFLTEQTDIGVYGTTAGGGSDDTYGTTASGGSNLTYGTGILARFYNTDNGIPFDIQLEQTVADMHWYNRNADPVGPATIGDKCVVQGKDKTCTSAGTPGTWTVTGTQT